MNIKNITQKYKYKTELHAHSNPVSKCGRFPADEVVKIYSDFGCDTLVLTNHLSTKHKELFPTVSEVAEYYLSDYYKATEAAKATDMSVALGVEIRFANTNNDYLVYGVCPDDIEKLIYYVDTDIQTFYGEFKNEKNVIIHAHPFRKDMEPTPIGSVDGVETFNCHPGHNSRIPYACRLAQENGLLVSGGSDFHEPSRHGTCITRTTCKLRDSYDVAEAIKSRDFVFDLFGHIVFPYNY